MKSTKNNDKEGIRDRLDFSRSDINISELLSMLSKTAYSDSALKGIEKLKLNINNLKDIYIMAADVNIKDLSEILSFYSYIDSGELDTLRVICSDSDGLDVKSMLLLTSLLLLLPETAIIGIEKALDMALVDLAIEDYRGKKIYEAFEDLYTDFLGKIVITYLFSDKELYNELEKIELPDDVVKNIVKHIRSYNGKVNISKLLRE